jgi:hypothetical protein
MKELKKLGNCTHATKILEVETAMRIGLASKNIPGIAISCDIHSPLRFNQFIINLLITSDRKANKSKSMSIFPTRKVWIWVYHIVKLW